MYTPMETNTQKRVNRHKKKQRWKTHTSFKSNMPRCDSCRGLGESQESSARSSRKVTGSLEGTLPSSMVVVHGHSLEEMSVHNDLNILREQMAANILRCDKEQLRQIHANHIIDGVVTEEVTGCLGSPMMPCSGRMSIIDCSTLVRTCGTPWWREWGSCSK